VAGATNSRTVDSLCQLVRQTVVSAPSRSASYDKSGDLLLLVAGYISMTGCVVSSGVETRHYQVVWKSQLAV